MNTELPENSRIFQISFGSVQLLFGAILVMLGSAVMIGWHSGAEALIQIFPGFAPMTYNAALGFCLCGLAFIFKARYRKFSLLTAFVIAMVGILTTIQYVTAVNFGIDELFVRAYLSVENSDPGRMAPVSAVCFILIGGGLMVRMTKTDRNLSILSTGLLGAVVSAFGLVALFGYAFDLTVVYGWGQITLMAVHTAIGFVFCGVGLIFLSKQDGRRLKVTAPFWLPVLVTIASLSASFSVWQAIYVQEKSTLDHTIQLEANNVKVHLEMELNARIIILEQMANRWSQRAAGMPEEEWRADAKRYIKDFSSYQAVEWADSNFFIRWVEPERGNEAAINLNLKTYTDRRTALEYARDNNVTVLTRKHTLSQGGSGIIVYTPIFKNDEFGGFIIGVFRTQELFDSILPRDFAQNYSVELQVDGDILFRHGETATKSQIQLMTVRDIESHGAVWKARIFPNSQTVETLHTSYDEVVLFIGLLMSGLLVVAVYLTQEARRRNVESVNINLDLRYEITERHRAAQELKASEQHNREIVEKSLGFICTHKLDGTLISINPAAANSLGYTPDEMIGNKISDFMPRSARRFFEGYLIQIQNKHELSGLFNVQCRSGERRIWEYNNSLYEQPGKGSYILAHAVDVTDRHRIESELTIARNAALESARIKSEFLANMSHEIRTPMNGVLGMTDLLADTPLDNTQREYLNSIKKSGEALLTIINDILDFSKIEAGKLRFDKIDFDLRNTVESSVELFAEQAGAKNIELASLVNSDVEVALLGDPGRLRQVLTNLMGNALKFTEKGEIIVRVEKEKETRKKIVLRFSVSDTGIGIKAAAQKTLFQPFTQADGSITRKFGGTGLGLTISKQLVEMMKGQINVESKFGKGSVFWFTASFEKQEIFEHKIETKQVVLGNLKALVVDDNRTNRMILTHQMKSWGIEVDEAADGRAALEKLLEAADMMKPFDLVVFDLLMPSMDGFELARAIRADSSLKDARLILMPSFGRRGHARMAKKTEIDGYLTKPIKQTDLFDCITTVVAGTGRKADSEQAVHKKLITKHTLQEIRENNSHRVLLVEDNAVNQKLIMIQLSRLGYRADLASNGVEAINAINKHSYDLVLMDCQMPEMDGYAATKIIRRSETNGKHLPIIAITANVMAKEVEKCFASGMDNCLAKPFSQQQLAAELNRWLTRSNDPSKQEQLTVSPAINNLNAKIANSVELRINELRSEIGFDVVDEIISLFAEDSAQRLENLRRAISEENLTQIQYEAHGLKGSSGNVGAIPIADLCLEIENASKAENILLVRTIAKKLDDVFPFMLKSLSAIRKKISETEAEKVIRG